MAGSAELARKRGCHADGDGADSRVSVLADEGALGVCILAYLSSPITQRAEAKDMPLSMESSEIRQNPNVTLLMATIRTEFVLKLKLTQHGIRAEQPYNALRSFPPSTILTDSWSMAR